MDNEPIVADCGNGPRNCNLFPGGGGGGGGGGAPGGTPPPPPPPPRRRRYPLI